MIIGCSALNLILDSQLISLVDGLLSYAIITTQYEIETNSLPMINTSRSFLISELVLEDSFGYQSINQSNL